MTNVETLKLVILLYALLLSTVFYFIWFWDNLSYKKKKRVIFFFRKVCRFVLGESIVVKENTKDLAYKYENALGLYSGGTSDRISIRNNSNKLNAKEALNQCAVFLHEMGHWTGHEIRCNRIQVGVDRYKSENSSQREKYHYVAEELIAELINKKLMKYLGFPETWKEDKSYLHSWLNRYKEFYPYSQRIIEVKTPAGEDGQGNILSKVDTKVLVKRKVPLKEYKWIVREAQKGYKYIIKDARTVRKIKSYILGKLATISE